MHDWIITATETYGYFGIFLLIALENLFPPIPSEVILPFAGFMTTTTRLTVPGVVMAATAGSVAGAVLLYGVGRVFSLQRLETVTDRWGHILRVTTDDLHRANAWFDRYGFWTVLFCRMVPLIRSLISIPAGMCRMRLPQFFLFTVTGTLAWNILLVSIGAALGESWETITHYIDTYSNIAYTLLALGGIAAVFLFVRSRLGKPAR